LRACQAAACWAAVGEEIGWVGTAAYVLYSSPTLHDTSYSAQQSKLQHSGVTGAHASETPAVPGLPAGQTCWRARWVSPVLRTCLIATTRYGRSRNQPLTNSQHGCPCCRRRGIAKPARTVTLSRRPSKQSWICCAAGSGCIWLRLGMRMPRVWRTAVLLAVQSDGSTCCVGTKIPFRFILHTFDGYCKHPISRHGCLNERMFLLLKYTCICTRSNSLLHF